MPRDDILASDNVTTLGPGFVVSGPSLLYSRTSRIVRYEPSSTSLSLLTHHSFFRVPNRIRKSFIHIIGDHQLVQVHPFYYY